MLTWRASYNKGYYAIGSLSPRASDSIKLEYASYNDSKIFPAIILIKNFGNDGTITARYDNGQVVEIPAYTNYNLSVANAASLYVMNKGRYSIDYMVMDSAAVTDTETARAFTANSASLYDLLMHFNDALTTNSGIEPTFLISIGGGTLSLATRAKFGSYACKCSVGGSHNLLIRNNSFYEFAKPFTLDMWIGLLQTVTAWYVIFEFGDGAVSLEARIANATDTACQIRLTVDGTTYTSVTSPLVTEAGSGAPAYSFVQLYKSGDSWVLRVDGVITLSFVKSYNTALNTLVLGDESGTLSGSCYIDEIRFSKGAIPSDFTIPTAPYY